MIKVLKFSFLAIAILHLIYAIFEIFTASQVIKTSLPHINETDLFMRLQLYLYNFGAVLQTFTLALFSFLGSRIAALLEGKAVGEDLRQLIAKARRAGDKTND